MDRVPSVRGYKPNGFLSQESAESALKIFVCQPLAFGAGVRVVGSQRPILLPLRFVLEYRGFAEFAVVGSRREGERFGHKGLRD